MDERLLEHYNNELRHLRETAGEFAREFPKIAERLALDKDAKEMCPDPYVERLLEGFAFLAARVHLKLDAEFPRFTQGLLETVYPHYLCPVPSMAVTRFDADESDGSLAEGVVMKRGTVLRSTLGKGERTACTFTTAQDVRLLPVKLKEVRYLTRDLAEANLPASVPAKAALRIRLQATAGKSWKEIQLDPLCFYIRGADELPMMLYEQIFAAKTGLVVQSPAERGKTLGTLPATCVRRVGFGDQEALLPPSPRSFEGYRLLREYFTFPPRFLFFELSGFADVIKNAKGDTLDLVIPLKQAETRLEGRLDTSALELFCTPVINLFPKTLDPISLSNRFFEFHVVPDRNRPLDFEIFQIKNVLGFEAVTNRETEFRPFYLARDIDGGSTGTFYTIQRVPRMLTAKERQVGRRSSYTGTEVYLSLVDADAAPYRSDLNRLGISALCTNRHLPIQMAVGIGPTDFTMDATAPITGIRVLTGPTLPRPSLAEGRFAWRLISHLSLNYLSLLDEKGDQGATALREILKLYADPNDRATLKQIDGVRSARAAPVVRRAHTPGPITFVRGLEITVNFEDSAFEGTGVFVLGAVLEQFFAKYVSLNSFTETVIHTQQRKEIMRWPAQVGRRQII